MALAVSHLVQVVLAELRHRREHASTAPRDDPTSFGHLVQVAEIASPETRAAALERQTTAARLLGEILVELGVSQRDVDRIAAVQARLRRHRRRS
jgi:hypothetical protein